jgi:hypothetical protein
MQVKENYPKTHFMPGVRRWQFKARFRARVFGWHGPGSIAPAGGDIRDHEHHQVGRRRCRGRRVALASGSGLPSGDRHVLGALGNAVNHALEELLPILIARF